MAVDTNILPPRYLEPTLIGHGGMGDIYGATDELLGRPVAIKLLAERYASDVAVRSRFTREALAAARLSGDPHTVTIFDVGEWNDRPFIVMEHLGGGSLEQKLREEGAQPTPRALKWLEQAARALDNAHAEGVVHRDVKPGNLLLDREGNVHVADFGIATAVGLDSLTQTGTIIGTAGYLSPEQAQGARATPCSDVYALGVVAFELLTGERPFQNESTTAEAAAHVHAPIPPISERNPDLPRELDPIFAMALAKDPSERYESCGAFVSELAWAIERTTGSIPAVAPAATVPMFRDRGGAPTRRLPWVPIAVALLLLLGATGAVLAALLPGDGDEQARATTFVKTVTSEGRTVQRTVTTTTEAPPPPQPTPPPAATPPPGATPPPPAPSAQSGEALTDQATSLLRGGRYGEALPVAQQGLAKLRGSGKLYEGYANYNVAWALVGLERCDEAMPYLDASEAIQGPRSEIAQRRAECG